MTRFSPDGTEQWSQAYGAHATGTPETVGWMHEGGRDIGVDAQGNVVINGAFTGTIDFGGGQVDGGFNGPFVLALDASGDYRWDHLVVQEPGYSLGVAVQADGNVAVVGAYRPNVALGTGYFIGFDPDGLERWAVTHGEDSDNLVRPRSIATHSSGAIIATGSFHGTIDFGNGPHTATEASLFVLPLCP